MRTRNQLGYAFIETPLSAIELMLQLYLLEFYINGQGLDPYRASTVVALAILWDAITDPVIGYFSDRCPAGRFGKRSVFMVPGAIGLAVSTIFIFNPVSGLSQGWLMIWLFASLLALNTTMTLLSIPHIACVGDYTDTQHQRNVLLGWRMLFANFGLLLSVSLPAILEVIYRFPNNKGMVASILAALIIVAILLCMASLHRLPLSHSSKPTSGGLFSFIRTLGSAFKNRFFLPLLLAFMVVGIARAVNSGLALFYYKSSLGLEEHSEVSLILLVFILAITVSIPLWVYAGKRWTKRNAVLLGMITLALGTVIGYPRFPNEALLGPLVMAVVGGISVGCILLIESMVVNAIDEDEKNSGVRKDAAYFGIWKMSAKASRALGMACIGPLLIWTGYDETLNSQPELTQQRIADVFGYVVGVLFLFSAIVFSITPEPTNRYSGKPNTSASM